MLLEAQENEGADGQTDSAIGRAYRRPGSGHREWKAFGPSWPRLSRALQYQDGDRDVSPTPRLVVVAFYRQRRCTLVGDSMRLHAELGASANE